MLEELFKLRDRVALLEKRMEAMELAQQDQDRRALMTPEELAKPQKRK